MSEESNSNGKRERSDEETTSAEEKPTKSMKNGDGDASQSSTAGTEDTANTEGKDKETGDPPAEESKEAGDEEKSPGKEAESDGKQAAEEVAFVLDTKGVTPEETKVAADPPVPAVSDPRRAAEVAPPPVAEAPPAAAAPAPVGVDPTVQPTVVNPSQIVEERGEIPALYVGKVIGKVRRFVFEYLLIIMMMGGKWLIF